MGGYRCVWVGECGGKWETKIILINGGAVCCLEGTHVSAAPHRTLLKALWCASDASRDTRRSSEYPPRTRESSKNTPFYNRCGGAGNLLVYITPILFPPPRKPLYFRCRLRVCVHHSTLYYSGGLVRGQGESSNILAFGEWIPSIWGKFKYPSHVHENIAYGKSVHQTTGTGPGPPCRFAATTWTAICELPRNLAYARITRISNKPPYLNKKILCKSL